MVLGKKIFLPHMGMAAILVMFSLYLKAYIQNLVENGPVVSEKPE